MKEPMQKETSVKFAIPDKCVTSKAPTCFSLTELVEEPPALAEDTHITPKRKRRDNKIALVESEVRRSPRLVLLNDGYKNHDNCSDKHCLTCNAAPPIINSKVVKNLAMSFCKVSEDVVEKRILKKGKNTSEECKAAAPHGVIGRKKSKALPPSDNEKGQQKATVLAQQAKKKSSK
jgi:hypothetical protein